MIADIGALVKGMYRLRQDHLKVARNPLLELGKAPKRQYGENPLSPISCHY